MPVVDRIVNVADARRFARRAVLSSIFDYVDAGAEDEVTKADNEQAFRTVTFRPRAGVRVGRPELVTTVLGTASVDARLARAMWTRSAHAS